MNKANVTDIHVQLLVMDNNVPDYPILTKSRRHVKPTQPDITSNSTNVYPSRCRPTFRLAPDGS